MVGARITNACKGKPMMVAWDKPPPYGSWDARVALRTPEIFIITEIIGETHMRKFNDPTGQGP